MPSTIPHENTEANIEKLEVLTGWRPPHSLETGIAKLIEHERLELTQPHYSHKQANILITSISKKMPLICAVRAAASKTGIYAFIYGADSDSLCMGQYGVDEFWESPPLDALRIEDFISYCHEKHVKALIPTRDGELGYFAAHHDLLIQSGIHPMISRKEVIDSCLDKYQFAEKLGKGRFPIVRTTLAIEDLKAQKYVVKERKGAGSRLIGLNLTKEEAMRT